MVSIKEEFRVLQLQTNALMGGLALFIAVVLFLNLSEESRPARAITSPQYDLLFVAGVGLFCLVASRLLASKVLASASREVRLDDRTAVQRYRSATVLRLAMLEGAGLMATVFALITGTPSLLLIAGFLLAMMWLSRPTQEAFNEWRAGTPVQ